MPFSPTRGKRVETNWLQVVTQIVALFAGVATIVYLAGGVVLSLRLAFADLPWGNVVSQMPRQFLISIGAGQVLFPALLFGTLYGLYRLLRRGRGREPELSRWRDGWSARPTVIWAYVQTFAPMTIPLVVIVGVRLHRHQLGWSSAWWIGAGLAVVAVAAIAAHETRAALIRHFRGPRYWRGFRGGAAMAGIYCAAAIPPLVVASAAIPLSYAKVCGAGNFVERGFLVGETSDSVYLGEETERHPRRIAVIPFTRVEELFVGPNAKAADCEFTSASAGPS